ncbi:MAG: 50S ribosomal protein L3 [Candidatus Woesearchaeota archaeon]
MPKHHHPRHASMQFWPRVRAKKTYARVRSWVSPSKDQILGFIGYKVGMTHVIAIDTRKTSPSKGEEIFIPVTVVECPPMKIGGIRFYKKTMNLLNPAKDILFKMDKEMSRKIVLAKKTHSLDSIKPEDYLDAKLLVYSQPKLAGIGKKKPEFFELGMNGTIAEKTQFAKENHDKELFVNTLFKEGEYLDIHAITKGKGLQGPVKRFGVPFKPHKSEKGVRRVGTLGAWSGQGHVLYRVPHPGQMGYHMRTEYNKQIMKISNKPEEVNPKGDWPHYGKVKSNYLLIYGSIAGAQKRAIIFTKATRAKTTNLVPTIVEISKESKN